LDFVRGHGEAFGDSMYLRYSQEVTWNLHFVCMTKQSISTEPAKYFLNVSFVFGNVVGIDEDVVQIYDDNDVDHIRKDVVHESLKRCWSISKPFRHY